MSESVNASLTRAIKPTLAPGDLEYSCPYDSMYASTSSETRWSIRGARDTAARVWAAPTLAPRQMYPARGC
jgi:hypothetical protein